MWEHVPAERTKTKFDIRDHVAYVITSLNLKGFRAVRGKIGIFHLTIAGIALITACCNVLPVKSNF